jgi:VIT1/CCC1 family predicted Fe2+/Mn2+ transporter
MAIALSLLWLIFHLLALQPFFWKTALLFTAGWIVWKTGRSALLGWSRMERLHRLIEEERWEIEHNRAQEREELTEMYRAKGLEGELLDGVIQTLMADDNRLLRVMLEEELGLTLEATEHPLKQAMGAFFGSAAAAALCLFGFWLAPSFGLLLLAGITLLFTSFLAIRLERNPLMHLLTWNLALAGVTIACVYFLRNLL